MSFITNNSQNLTSTSNTHSLYSPDRFIQVEEVRLLNGKNRVKVKLPKDILNNEAHLYQWVFKKDNSEERRYVGETRDVRVRTSGHVSRANCLDSKIKKKTKQKFHKNLKRYPSDFQLGLKKIPNDESPREFEKKAIAYYRGKKDLFNVNEGGGGPACKRKLPF